MFDPRIKYATADEQEASRVVWNSTNVQWALDAIADGLPLKKGVSPFFDGDIKLRKGELNFKYTQEEFNEFARCKTDIIYFANKYCKLVTDTGMTDSIKLRKYQKRILRAMQIKKYVIILSGRQIGKTTTTAIFLLWKMIFHRQESIALLGDKLETAKENLRKIKEIMAELPFFLKPGIMAYNERSVNLDNKSKIFTGACKKSSLVGKTLTCLYIDELDIPLANQSQELVEYALPTIAAIKKGQAIFSSTPSVGGIFKKTFMDAKEGKNSFHPIQVNWWEVPGRTIQWKQEMLNQYGKDAFNVQFNCRFLSSTQTIFNEDFLEYLERKQDVYTEYLTLHDDWENYKVLPFAFDLINANGNFMLDQVEPIMKFRVKRDTVINWKKDYFIITCDIAEGIGGDDTVFNFWRLKATKKQEKVKEDKEMETTDTVDFLVDDDGFVFEDAFEDYNISWEQVGIFQSNEASVKATSYFLRSFCTKKMDPNRFKISVEYNKYGESVLNYLCTESVGKLEVVEVENVARTTVNEKSKAGVHITTATKQIYVPNAKSDLETGRIDLTDPISVDQLKYFGKVKNSFAAADGFKDDIVMTVVNLSAYIDVTNENYIAFLEEAIDDIFGIANENDDDDGNDVYFDDW